MNIRHGPFACLLAALVAGCSPAPTRSAQADEQPQPATATATDDIAVPDPPVEEAALVAPPPPPAKKADNSMERIVPAPQPDRPDPPPRVKPRANPLDLPPSDAAAQDDTPFPDEVTAFMVERDGCDHFRGEHPYDAERRAYLEDSIAQLCAGTDAKLAALRRRYGGNPAVIAALDAYEDRIEEPGEDH